MNSGGDMSSKIGSIGKSELMKRVLIGLCALNLLTGLAFAPKVEAQSITITVGPATDDSYWVWNDEYQCWIWNGPEFQGDYQGHPYSYWHGRHHEEWGRDRRPGKGERSEGERPVNKGDVVQPKAEQPKAEVERSNGEQHKADVEKPKEQQPKTEIEKPKRKRRPERRSLNLKRSQKQESLSLKRKKTTPSQRENDRLTSRGEETDPLWPLDLLV